MITKFNSASIPSFVREGEFTIGVPAWWVTVGNNEHRLKDGDYIITEDGIPVKFIPSEEYTGITKVEVDRLFGQQLINEILADHKPLSLEEDVAFVAAIDAVDKSLRYGKLELTKDILAKLVDPKVVSEQVKVALVSKIDGFVKASDSQKAVEKS